MGSQPASMDAGRTADCYGMFPGHDVEQADAEQAYIQADLTGTETWVLLPEDAWPDDWWEYSNSAKSWVPKYNKPVVRLKKYMAIPTQAPCGKRTVTSAP